MKLAFVIPWYGPDIPGGAEDAIRRTAGRLARAGLPVEVLTTCVKEFGADWSQNDHAPGLTHEDGVPVRRFRADARDRTAFDTVNLKLLAGLPVTPAEEETFFRENVNSAALVDYIGAHRGEYTYIFIPYIFGTTYAGLRACDGDAFLIPCLHDEPYARMALVGRMMATARGLILHSAPEAALASRLYGLPGSKLALFGIGVDGDVRGDATAFRQKYGINGPFVLYAGRKDEGKNVDLLIRYFRSYHRGRPDVALVLLGGGRLPEAVAPGEGIYDLGFVPAQDKQDACAAATLLCQPSLRESFSLVLMEGWVAGTPALVHGDCAVTWDHCVRGQGGLCFTNYAEFRTCLDLLLDCPGLRARLGQNGRRYVQANYSWDRIVGRYAALLEGAAGG